MQAELSTIVQQLFQQPSLDQVSVETLREFTRNHPYAGIGHVLLAKKEKAERERAVFYVDNPLWLDYILEDRRQETGDRRLEAGGSRQEAGDRRQEEEKREEKEEEKEKEKESVAVPAKDEGLVFEPYHTIDYFASMGIKLTREDLDKDQFGRQLKSFTEWLKSMKKITPVAGAQPEKDVQIEQKAAASVQPSEVDTEAMAEVWLKQGNKEKALAIYRKLSLQNPSKSHYFASLIEQINA